jgi:hypothetical protein
MIFELCSLEVQYYVQIYSAVRKGFAEKRYDFLWYINKEQEDQFIEYVIFMVSLFYGLTREEFKKIAYDLMEEIAVPHISKRSSRG